MAGWTAERIWGEIDAWRWVPPSAVKVVARDYELAVTPGSYALTFVYGFRAGRAELVEERLAEVERRVRELGGTGAHFQVTPQTLPADLPARLLARGYRQVEETEALAFELRDGRGRLSLPEFRPAPGITVREVEDDSEYGTFMDLAPVIFGSPPASEEARRAFFTEFHEVLRSTGHSNRFIAWEGAEAIGRGGLDLHGKAVWLWSAGVLPEKRGRGVYGALVRARCEAAAARGAEVAVVTARVGTSGPILKRHGFKAYGFVKAFEARW